MTDLKTLVATDSSIIAPKVLLYGVHGIGKSTFGSQCPKPVFLQTEDGLRGKNFKGVARLPICKDWNDVKQYMKMLIGEQHEYKTLVVDSIDWLQRLIFQDIAQDKGEEDINDIGYSVGYRIASTRILTFLDLCSELHASKGMMICLLGHSNIVSFDPPDGNRYDRYSLDLHKWVAPLVFQWSDLALFVNYKTRLRKAGDSFGKDIFKGIAGEAERIMYTEERATHMAKNRYGLPYEMEFSWAALQKQLF